MENLKNTLSNLVNFDIEVNFSLDFSLKTNDLSLSFMFISTFWL